MNKMIRVKINADDFGISQDVNDAIRLCFEKRMITSTTLMVNMPYAPDAVKIAKEEGFDERVGLHLNLTAGVPLTGAIRSSRTFCDKRGMFHAGFHLSTGSRIFLPMAEKKLLAEEIEAQVRRYLAFGLPLKHLDSHHHVHTDLSVWSVAQPILLKYGFRSARLSRNIYAEGRTSAVNSIYKKYYNNLIKKAGFEVTDYFGSFEDFEAAFDKLQENSIAEIMVHPMFSESGDLVDTELLMSEEKAFIDKRHILTES